MSQLDLVILVFASLANLTIGFFSFAKSQHSWSNRLFALLTLTLVGWTSANYVTIVANSPEITLFAVQLILLFVVLQNTSFYLFSAAFPTSMMPIRRSTLRLYLGFSILVLFVSAYPGFFTGYNQVGNTISPNPNPLIALFIVHTIFSIGAGYYRLIRRYRRAKGRLKDQLTFLIVASSILFTVAPLTNFVLPIAADFNVFSRLSPLYTLLFAGLIAYAMVKHRLLDFGSLVARALGYVLTLGFLALVYTLAIFGLSAWVFKFEDIRTTTQLIFTVLALVLAFTLQPIKRFFDRQSNKIFFQDAYDPQEFLDEFNKILVAGVELNPLLVQVAAVIEKNLKSEYSLFVINSTHSEPERHIVTKKNKAKFSLADMNRIVSEIPSISNGVIVQDQITDTHPELYQLMQHYDIAAIANLVSVAGNKPTSIGFLLLGQKKSGNTYTGQDINIIEIIANELVIAVQNALRFEEIEQFNIKLKQEVQDATHQLRQTNQKLREMDETKDEFISMASHQLRTPLTSVKGYLSMVLEGDVGKVSKAQRQMLDQAFMSSQRMVYLIADLLNVSRLRTGKFIVETVETDLPEVVQGEVDQLKETAATRDLELTYDKPKNFPKLMLNETKIRQVIMNFIDNAIYYTPAGGHIRVKLAETPESIEFTVVDDGIGVPRSEQHQLFNKFYRAGNARKARPDGTGLGLFMAKKVVVAQGGSVIFHSVEGKGSTFGFRFAKEKLMPKQP